MLDACVDDPKLAHICNDAMDKSSEQSDRYRILDDILATHAEAIKNVLDIGVDLDQAFVEHLLGEHDSVTTASLSITEFKLLVNLLGT